MLGTSEMLIIAVVVLLLFGASAIPKFARSLGEAKREFAKASKEAETDAPEAKAGSAAGAAKPRKV